MKWSGGGSLPSATTMGEFSYRIPRTIPSVLNSRIFVASMMSATSRRVASPTNPGSSRPVVRAGCRSARNCGPLRRSFAHGLGAVQVRKTASRSLPPQPVRHAPIFHPRSTASPIPIFMPKPPNGGCKWQASPAKNTRSRAYLSATSRCATHKSVPTISMSRSLRPVPRRTRSTGIDSRDVDIVDQLRHHEGPKTGLVHRTQK